MVSLGVVSQDDPATSTIAGLPGIALVMHSIVESNRKCRRGNEVVRGDRMRAILIR
jgi:hypothetical protein